MLSLTNPPDDGTCAPHRPGQISSLGPFTYARSATGMKCNKRFVQTVRGEGVPQRAGPDGVLAKKSIGAAGLQAAQMAWRVSRGRPFANH
jgi:hypothetical protein